MTQRRERERERETERERGRESEREGVRERERERGERECVCVCVCVYLCILGRVEGSSRSLILGLYGKYYDSIPLVISENADMLSIHLHSWEDVHCTLQQRERERERVRERERERCMPAVIYRL